MAAGEGWSERPRMLQSHARRGAVEGEGKGTMGTLAMCWGLAPRGWGREEVESPAHLSVAANGGLRVGVMHQI